MSDLGPNVDFQTLYDQLLQQYPRSKGKSASPQADLKAALAWKNMIDKELGFDPLTYESPMKKEFTPQQSAVELQYGNDPFVSATLSDLKDGSETSASVAAKLLDPTTGEVKPELAGSVTPAQASNAVDAAKAWEKEASQNKAAQLDYQNRQENDPTFGRTPGSTGGKHILPEGDINGTETPQFSYSDAIAEMLNGLSTSDGKVSLPMAAPRYGHPTEVRGQIATRPQNGGLAVDTSIHGTQAPSTPATSLSPQEMLLGTSSVPPPTFARPAAGEHRQMTDIVSPATGTFARQAPAGNPLFHLAQFANRIAPHRGASSQERAVAGLQGMQDYATKYMKPVRSAANRAAVEKLLNVIALQGQ